MSMKNRRKTESKKTLLTWVRETLSRHETELKDTVRCPCPYAMKRNIVVSLEEIRRFAEKHNLAATLTRALLTLLAEMAVGALHGKVGEKALETLLNAFNYTRHVNDAYIRGRNEKIETEYFPENKEVPHLGGMQKDDPDDDESIFNIAKDA